MERDSTIYLGGINIRFSTMNRVLPFYLIYAKVVRQQTNFAISQRKSQSEGLPKSVQLTNPRSLSIHSHSYLLALVHNRRRRFSLRSIQFFGSSVVVCKTSGFFRNWMAFCCKMIWKMVFWMMVFCWRMVFCQRLAFWRLVSLEPVLFSFGCQRGGRQPGRSCGHRRPGSVYVQSRSQMGVCLLRIR